MRELWIQASHYIATPRGAALIKNERGLVVSLVERHYGGTPATFQELA